jgi:hypothetical protein
LNAALWLAMVAAAGLAGMVGGYMAARVRHGAAAAAAYAEGVADGVEAVREEEEDTFVYDKLPQEQLESITIH